MAASSLTTTCSTTARRKGLLSHAPAPTRRMTVAMSNRKLALERSEGTWSVVRRLIGYDRYDSRTALEALNRVYDLTRLYVNFFQPDMKLVHKSRHGARVHKFYDTAQTPYRRLLSAGILTEVKQQELAAMYHRLNPALLLRQINENLERLWDMARYPATQPGKGKTKEASVTGIMRQPLTVR